MAFNTMYFAALAHINVGIITTVWALTPLFMAIADSCIFHIKLEYFHYIGMFCIVICTVVLSLNDVINQDRNLPIMPGQPTQQFTPIRNQTEHYAE